MNGPGWLDRSELRIGLGCMRLSTDEHRDEQTALETIAAAVDAGITVFDTAHAYGRGDGELGHNERLLAAGLRRCGATNSARVVTKGGMARSGGGWMPDGRAIAIQSDCEASLVALDGLAIDLFLLHAPDPRTSWQTSLRALARLVDRGLVRRVGVSNVNRRQLGEARDVVPISAVQIALSVYDDNAIRGGLLEYCADAGITVMAHSPLGGPRRAAGIARHASLSQVAARAGVTAAEVALAWLLDVSPAVVAIPGARRPETARSAAHAATIELDADARDGLAAAFARARSRASTATPSASGADVAMVMGIPGSGKSRVATEYVAQGYLRLNRDDRGGSLRDIASALEAALAAGSPRVVLDNTYLTRAVRSDVIDAARQHGAHVRCIWLDTPLAQAQVNLVERLLGRYGSLPAPDELRVLARSDPGTLTPTSQMRAVRELEPPSADEGFSAIDHRAFARTPDALHKATGVFVAAGAVSRSGWAAAVQQAHPGAAHLVFDWSPDGDTEALDSAVALLRNAVGGVVDGALCSHGGGPPTCWCRPPLPGLALAFARRHSVDPARSTLIGTGPAHRTLAGALGARYVEA